PLLSFFFTDPATPDLSTLSLHDALPILPLPLPGAPKRINVWYFICETRLYCKPAQLGKQNPTSYFPSASGSTFTRRPPRSKRTLDRKSTRLNSSHLGISYAVFCLKKKKK